MKRNKMLLLAAVLGTMTIFAACGPKKDAAPENGAAQSTENETAGAETGSSSEEQTITGTADSLKDFQFVLTTDDGAAYIIPLVDGKPDTSDIEEGDKVIVTYTGEMNEVDAFTGTIISVEKAE